MNKKTEAEESKQRALEELEDRARRPLIIHETVPGEDPIVSGGSDAAKEKARKSTSDEDLC